MILLCFLIYLDVEQMPTSPMTEPTKTVSSKDIDSASVADSGLGTTISEEPQQAPRRSNTGIDSASIAESGYGPSILSDPEKATSTKEKLLNQKANVRESVMHTCMHAFIQIPKN